jgi:hypothetical protein
MEIINTIPSLAIAIAIYFMAKGNNIKIKISIGSFRR